MHAWSARIRFLLHINSHSPPSLSLSALCSVKSRTNFVIRKPLPRVKSRTRNLRSHGRIGMRPSPMDTTPGAAVRTVVIHLLAPPPAACGLNGCRLRTTNVPSSFSSSGDILTYVIVLVLCFLLCALALTFAVRCFLRDQPPPLPLGHPPPLAGQGEAEPKPTGEAAAPPLAAAALMVFSPGVELAGAEADCAICLTEFVGGEEIRVLKSCRHGFHDQCIQRWLSSKTSCPTCRSSCVVHCAEDEDGTAHCSENGGTAASLPQRVAEQV